MYSNTDLAHFGSFSACVYSPMFMKHASLIISSQESDDFISPAVIWVNVSRNIWVISESKTDMRSYSL